METTTQQARNTMFRIGDWKYPRHARIGQDGTIRLEIARTACRHCPTCAGRIRAVEHRLQGKNGWGWEQNGAGVYLVLSRAEGSTPLAVDSYLSELLRTSVTEER